MESHLQTMFKLAASIERILQTRCHRCLYPECASDAIRSHSQQKAGPLQAIADQGLVYAFKSDIVHYWVNSGPVISRIGIGKASIFPGFCNDHDTKLFSLIEAKALSEGNKEQADLFFIRCYAYEYTRKKRSVDWLRTSNEEYAKQGIPYNDALSEQYCSENEHFMQIEKPFYIDRFFFDPTFKSELCFKWRVVPGNLGVSVSCCFPPLSDKELLEYANSNLESPLPMVTFTLLPESNQTHVILGWHQSFSNFVQPMVNRLMSHDPSVLEQFINECVFTKSEDFCIKPSLWDSTTDEIKQQVSRGIRHEHFRGPLSTIPTVIRVPWCLTP